MRRRSGSVGEEEGAECGVASEEGSEPAGVFWGRNSDEGAEVEGGVGDIPDS